MKILIIFTVLIFSSLSMAQSDPKAIECLEKFINRYGKVKRYKGTVHKIEYRNDSVLSDTSIQIDHTVATNNIWVKFLNEGKTGIKNNGMTVLYEGGDDIQVRLGKPKFVGKPINFMAAKVLGDRTPLLSKYLLADENFTFNRITISYLVYMMSKNLESLKKAKFGGLKLKGPNCHLRYEKHRDEVFTEVVKEGMFPIEEKYGTLTFMILESNRPTFQRIKDLFLSSKGKKINIPSWFFDFELKLNSEHLPQKLTFYLNDKVFGTYNYAFNQID